MFVSVTGRSRRALLQSQVLPRAHALLHLRPAGPSAQHPLPGLPSRERRVCALRSPEEKACKRLYLLFLVLPRGRQETERMGQKPGTCDKSIFFPDRTHLCGKGSGINKPSTSSQVCCVKSKVMRSLWIPGSLGRGGRNQHGKNTRLGQNLELNSFSFFMIGTI